MKAKEWAKNSGGDRTRDEEPGREMEGDTVMTMNTRDNSNQKEPISFKKTAVLFLQFPFYRVGEIERLD